MRALQRVSADKEHTMLATLYTAVPELDDYDEEEIDDNPTLNPGK
jgi:hypothetical protein